MGAEVWRIAARPFGETVAITATAANDNRFPGQVFDAESGLHYNYFRDYDPSLGRYLQSDPIGLAGGLNTYAYVGGNPVGRIGMDRQRVAGWIPCLDDPCVMRLNAALCQNVSYDGSVHVGKPKVATCMPIGQLGVIHAKQMEDRGV